MDTNAASSSLRMKLSGLDVEFAKFQYDVTRCNGYVVYLVDTLKARGETTENSHLLVNLFKGYMVIPDKQFHSFVVRKREAYEEEVEINLTPGRLMELAKNRADIIIERGEWQCATAEEKELAALKAELSEVKRKSHRKRLGKNDSAPLEKRRKKNDKPLPAWMHDKPDDPAKVITYNEKSWWWCSKENGGQCTGDKGHGQYRRHKPNDCRQNSFQANAKDKQPSKPDKGNENNPNDPQMQLEQTLAKVAIQGDESDYEQDE